MQQGGHSVLIALDAALVKTLIMRRDGLPRHLIIAFFLALGGYVFFFACDQRIRSRKGAWVVQFGSSNTTPVISVSQRSLGLTNLQIVFDGETMTNSTAGEAVVFDKPLQPAPYGEVLFEDLTYLPGSVAFNFFGHEVELLPRVLILDRKELPWASHETIHLLKDQKPPEAQLPLKLDRQRIFREQRQRNLAPARGQAQGK
jgi:hypothetical protein